MAPMKLRQRVTHLPAPRTPLFRRCIYSALQHLLTDGVNAHLTRRAALLVIVSLGALALMICIALGLILSDGPHELTHPNRFSIPAGLIISFAVGPRFAAHRLPFRSCI
jgi:hypothetical protein